MMNPSASNTAQSADNQLFLLTAEFYQSPYTATDYFKLLLTNGAVVVFSAPHIKKSFEVLPSSQ